MAGPAPSSTFTLSSPATSSSATSGAASPQQYLDTVLRGYERRQVDEFVVEQNKEIARLKMELAEEQRKRRLATDTPRAPRRSCASCGNARRT